MSEWQRLSLRNKDVWIAAPPNVWAAAPDLMTVTTLGEIEKCSQTLVA